MSTPALRTTDAYRKHSRPRALDEARPHLLRRILAAVPLGMTAHALSERTGLAIEATHLYDLREGVLDRWSDTGSGCSASGSASGRS